MGLNKNLDMNALLKTAAFCCIHEQSFSGHGFESYEISVGWYPILVVEAVGTVIWAIRLASAVGDRPVGDHGAIVWYAELCQVIHFYLFRKRSIFAFDSIVTLFVQYNVVCSLHRGCFLTSSLIGTLALSLTIPLSIIADICMQKVRGGTIITACLLPSHPWAWLLYQRLCVSL